MKILENAPADTSLLSIAISHRFLSLQNFPKPIESPEYFANSVLSSVKEKVISLQTKLDDKGHTVKLLRDALKTAKAQVEEVRWFCK